MLSYKGRACFVLCSIDAEHARHEYASFLPLSPSFCILLSPNRRRRLQETQQTTLLLPRVCDTQYFSFQIGIEIHE